MADWLLGIGGGFLIGLVMLDVVWSTLSASGGGPITGWLGGHLWQAARRVHNRFRNHKLLQAAGVCTLLTVVGTWLVLVYFGWFLIFSIEPGAIVDSQTQQAASVGDRVYFIGFTLFSLGVGDFVASSEFWRILSIVACLNGLSLITLSITYLVPVISTVTTKRQLAELISALGSDPVDIVDKAWNGQDFAAIEQTLLRLNDVITLIAQRHLVYPVLHFFHSPQISSSIAVSIARLDEAVTILRHGIEPSVRPDKRILRETRHAIGVYMSRISSTTVGGQEQVPPLPSLDRLRQADVPLTSVAQIERAFEERSEDRKKLLTIVEVDGWRWEEGCGVKGEEEGGS